MKIALPSIRVPVFRVGAPKTSTTVAATESTRNVLRLPGNANGATKVPMDDRVVKILRAVVAAAALGDPTRAANLAALARSYENPGDAITALTDEQRGIRDEILNAVADVLDSGDEGETPRDDHRAMARALGVDPVLVATASKVIGDDEHKADVGIRWALRCDRHLLDTAAWAAARVTGIAEVPNRLGDIKRLRRDVRDLKQDMMDAEAAIDVLGKGTDVLATDVRNALSDAIDARKRVDGLATRVEVLENKSAGGPPADPESQGEKLS